MTTAQQKTYEFGAHQTAECFAIINIPIMFVAQAHGLSADQLALRTIVNIDIAADPCEAKVTPCVPPWPYPAVAKAMLACVELQAGARSPAVAFRENRAWPTRPKVMEGIHTNSLACSPAHRQ